MKDPAERYADMSAHAGDSLEERGNSILLIKNEIGMENEKDT